MKIQQTETTRTKPSTTKNSKWTMKDYNKLKPREHNLLQQKTPNEQWKITTNRNNENKTFYNKKLQMNNESLQQTETTRTKPSTTKNSRYAQSQKYGIPNN